MSLLHVLHRLDDIVCPVAVSTCEEALERLNESEAPDVVLMDLSMPGMGGIEGTRRIKDLHPDVYIIALTVHDDEQHVMQALLAGASGYLLKPASKKEIEEAVRAVVDGGSPITPQVASIVLKFFKQYVPARKDHDLSKTEHLVLQHLAAGRTKREIAEILIKSEHTVDTHVRHIYKKLDVHSRAGAVNKAMRYGLVRGGKPL